MRVMRWGARANHGNRSIKFDKFKIEWCAESATFDLKPEGAVTDFATDARHYYIFELSTEEIVKIIKGVDEQLSDVDQSMFVKTFEPALAALNRLTNAASGVWFPPRENS